MSSPDTFGGGDGDSFSAGNQAGDLRFTAIPLTAAGEAEDMPGWLVCNGAAVDRGKYTDLFNKIGVAYGPGDGVSTFNLPNYRSVAWIGAGPGHALGTSGGEATHTLTPGELAAHAHGVNDPGHAHGAAHGQFVTMDSNSPGTITNTITGGGNDDRGVVVAVGGTGVSVAAAGGGLPHNNLSPFQTIGGALIKF